MYHQTMNTEQNISLKPDGKMVAEVQNVVEAGTIFLNQTTSFNKVIIEETE